MAGMAFIFSILCCLMLVQESYQIEEKTRKGAILNQMREWGARTFESGLYNTGAVKNQFLVAAVISQSTLNDVTELQLVEGCPIQPAMVNEQKFSDTSLICARSAVIFNRVDEKVWENSKWHDNEAYKDHSWHGEYLFLHEGILEALQKNAKPNMHCEIILYSYFIPCNYHSDKQPYRCSELLSGYDSSKDKCKISTIGYTSAHPATAKNLPTALASLQDKYDVIKLADSDAVLVDVVIKSIAQSSTMTFQDVFYSCLRQSSIGQCCIDSRDGNPDRIFSYYTNHITRNVLKSINYGGRLSATKAQKTQLENKFQLEIPLTLGTECARCPGEISKRRMGLFVKTCAKKAFDMTDFFGKTEGPQLMQHIWEKYNDKWVNLYRNIQDGFWEDSLMRCLFGTSVPSLCTIKDTRVVGPDRKRPKPDDEYRSGTSNLFSNPFVKRPHF